MKQRRKPSISLEMDDVEAAVILGALVGVRQIKPNLSPGELEILDTQIKRLVLQLRVYADAA